MQHQRLGFLATAQMHCGLLYFLTVLAFGFEDSIDSGSKISFALRAYVNLYLVYSKSGLCILCSLHHHNNRAVTTEIEGEAMYMFA